MRLLQLNSASSGPMTPLTNTVGRLKRQGAAGPQKLFCGRSAASCYYPIVPNHRVCSIHTSTLSKMAGPVSGQQTGRMLRWWTRVRDVPELTVLGALVGGVVVLATYTVKKTLLNNESGSYPSVAVRSDPWKQVETGRAGLEDAATGKHSWLYKVAQYKMDKDGANIGIIFDNRVRPHQYSKPGAGYAGGLGTMETL